MEHYKRFSYKPWPHEIYDSEKNKEGLDELVSRILNKKIVEWATGMAAKHKNFTYRIVNAESFLDPRVKTDPGLESATVVVHVVYHTDQIILNSLQYKSKSV